MTLRHCLNCDVPFEMSRSDHFFHNGACKAAFYRTHPNPEQVHSELPHDEPHVCEQCGKPYNVNAYAERGGKRAPKYCSPKCKQAAYRARGQNPQEQAKRRYEANWREETTRKSQERTRRTDAPPPPPRRPGRMTFEQACLVLGLSHQHTASDLKSAYRKQMKVWHPDVNKAPEALFMAQQVNAAYDYLKR